MDRSISSDDSSDVECLHPNRISKFEKYDVAIIGSGAAGNSAAMYTKRYGLKTIVFAGEYPGGQLTRVGIIDNYPGFHGDGRDLVDIMRNDNIKAGCDYENDTIIKADLEKNLKELYSKHGKCIKARAVIIASGAEPKFLGLEAEKKFLGHGISISVHTEAHLFANKSVVVIGGANSASKTALRLKKVCSDVIIVTRGEQMRSSKNLIERVQKAGIKIITNANVTNITGDTSLTGVEYTDKVTNESKYIRCDGVFIAIGQTPSTSLFKGQLNIDENGKIVTNKSTKTNIPGVFAAGDCTDTEFQQVISAAGDGAKAGLKAYRYIDNFKN